MKITSLNYKGGIDWGIDTKNMEFIKCADVKKETPYRIYGVFITKDRGYGRGAIAILDGALLSMPQRYVEIVETILNDEEMVQEIKEGKVAIEIDEFVSEEYKKVGYDITFVEV